MTADEHFEAAVMATSPMFEKATQKATQPVRVAGGNDLRTLLGAQQKAPGFPELKFLCESLHMVGVAGFTLTSNGLRFAGNHAPRITRKVWPRKGHG
jgi:hypothetical protein